MNTQKDKERKQLENLIYDFVSQDDYRPMKPRALGARIGLGDDDQKALKRAIKQMIKKGRIIYGPKHLIMKAKRLPGKVNKGKSDEVVGVYRRASGGYGFVTPDGSTVTDRSEDVYIAKLKSADAANGDTVRIKVSRRREGAKVRVSGRVLEVLDRRTHRFVGSYTENAGYGIVIVDKGVFDTGILVGDAGAKNCRIGDKVVIEMANFPSDSQQGEGVIVEVLGDRGKPGVDTTMIIREFDLPGEFPEAVLDDAREQAEKFDESKIEDGRTDFTKTTVITIDPKTARDFDDAISLEQLDNGHWVLGVHIADVSHFVPYRSVLDNEAFKRATSVYLPDQVIPMLPEIISNNLASLQPDRVRYTMTAMIEMTDEGVHVNTELHRGAIKSCHRFNYEEIDEYLEDDKPWKAKLTPEVFSLVRNMHTLAMKLRKRRMTRGSIDLALPEVKVDLDKDGRVSGAHLVDHTESHQVIEEFMLAANEAVAQELSDQDLYLMRRVHENPTEAKLEALTKFVRMLGIECESLQDRFEIKRVVKETADLPESHAIQFAILRSMQKAIYSPREIGHYALASKNYCHFTSPIRRYPDLIIHRMVGDLVDGKKPESNFERLASLGVHCSELERRAEQAERELKKLKLLNYLVDRIGMEMEGVVTGCEAFGLFVQGIELPAEGLVPVLNLPEDHYHFDRPSRTLSGKKEKNQFRLGDRMKVRVAMVDPDQRQLEFEVVGVTKRAGSHAPRVTRSSDGSGARGKGGSGKGKPKKRGLKKGDGGGEDERPWEERRGSGKQKGQGRHNRKPKEKNKLTSAERAKQKKDKRQSKKAETEGLKPKKKKKKSGKKKSSKGKPSNKSSGKKPEAKKKSGGKKAGGKKPGKRKKN